MEQTAKNLEETVRKVGTILCNLEKQEELYFERIEIYKERVKRLEKKNIELKKELKGYEEKNYEHYDARK